MRKRIVIYLLCAAMLGCLSGCGSTQDAAEQENICVYPATTDQFDNLADFLNFAATAESGDGLSDLASLEYFYLPTGLPEGYTLYKINSCKKDIAFYYLPEESAASRDNAHSAELNHENFTFISSRGDYVFESMMDQFDVTADDLVNGKFIVDETTTTMVVWEEDGIVLMMYLPRGYVAEDWDALLKTEKIVI